jgi:hypothetical protein
MQSLPHSATTDNGYTESIGDAFEPAGAPPEGFDLFDPANLALGQDFAAAAGVKQKIDRIKVEKPSKEKVFRVHPDAAFSLKTVLLLLKDDNEVYLVHPQLRHALRDEKTCGQYELFACISKAGTPFLWPVCLAGRDGKWNDWHESAWKIAQHAKVRWTRMASDRDAGQYVGTYDDRDPELQQQPDWPPDLPFKEWLRLAFAKNTIDSVEHPVLKRLRLED